MLTIPFEASSHLGRVRACPGKLPQFYFAAFKMRNLQNHLAHPRSSAGHGTHVRKMNAQPSIHQLAQPVIYMLIM